MQLKVLLPFEVFADVSYVTRMVVQTSAGAMGLLPQRLDCVAVMVPGILSYQSAQGDEHFMALDQGVLVKTGPLVQVSVRRAIGGRNLEELHSAVAEQFHHINAQEQTLRAVMTRLDSGLLQRFAEMTHDQ
jgi:F-type H+-transporting ATPase subunit epsilon